jgi:hypothetical protein
MFQYAVATNTAMQRQLDMVPERRELRGVKAFSVVAVM